MVLIEIIDVVKTTNNTYDLCKNPDGELYLSRYNKKYKMFVEIHFNNNSSGDNFKKEIISLI